MAAEGTRYLQPYCGTSVCAPGRASFFTGLHSGHCPIRGNWEIAPEGQLPLPTETVTIAEVAKAAGYATSAFGEWGMAAGKNNRETPVTLSSHNPQNDEIPSPFSNVGDRPRLWVGTSGHSRMLPRRSRDCEN